MLSRFYISLLFVLILFQPSCKRLKTLKLQGNLESPETLQVSLPESDFDFRFLQGYKEIQSRHYYYESSRWVNRNKNIDLYVSYTFLLDNYVFLNGKSMEELINETFEDRVVSIGDKKQIIREIANESSEDDVFSNGESAGVKKATYGKTIEVNDIVPVELQEAACFYFRRFQTFNANPADSVTGGSVHDIQGDAKLIGYLCDYGKAIKSEQMVENFIRDINARKVLINTQLKELKKKSAD